MKKLFFISIPDILVSFCFKFSFNILLQIVVFRDSDSLKFFHYDKIFLKVEDDSLRNTVNLPGDSLEATERIRGDAMESESLTYMYFL